jgi:hypothetical protein
MCLPAMNAGTEPAEHALTTPLALSEDAAGEIKNVRLTASPSARGSNPRGIAITLLPCREYVKPLDDTANGARVRTDRPTPGPPCRRVNPLSPSDLTQAKPPPRPRRLDPGTLTTVDTVPAASLSPFQQSATSEGGFDAAEKGWLFDRRRLDRRGLDLLAVVDYWLSLPSSSRSILGSTGRGRPSSMSAPYQT